MMLRSLARYLAALVVLLLPLYYFRFSIFGLPTNGIEILILVVVILAFASKPTIPKKIPTGIVWAVVLIIAGIFVGVIVSGDLRTGLGILKGWFILPALFGWSVWYLFDAETLPWLYWALILNMTLVSLYALGQWGGWIPLLGYQTAGGDLGQYIAQGRALAFFESPNFLAMYLVPLVALGASFLWQRTNKIWLVLLSAVLPIVAIYLSGSRAGLLALFGVAVILIFWSKHKNWAVVLIAASIVVAFLGFVTTNKANTGDAARAYIWQQAGQLIVQHPVTGIGPGQFQKQLDQKVGTDSYYQSDVRPFALHPHNLFLSLWLSGGLLALIGMIWLYVQVGWTAIGQKINGLALGAWAALVAVFLQGLFDTTYFKNDLALIFYLTLAIWIMSIPQKNINPSK